MDSFTVKDLIDIAKQHKIPYSGLRKQGLYDSLKSAGFIKPKSASPKKRASKRKSASPKRKSASKSPSKKLNIKKPDCKPPNEWRVGKGCFKGSSPKHSPIHTSPKFEIPTESNIRALKKDDIIKLIKTLYSKHIKEDQPKMPQALKKDKLVILALEAVVLAKLKLKSPKRSPKRSPLNPNTVEQQLTNIQAPLAHSREYMENIEKIQKCLGLI